MNNCFILKLFIWFLFLISCFSDDAKACCFPNTPIVEFRVSYFRPVSSEFRETFHDGGAGYQLTSTLPIYCGPKAWGRGINLWTALDYFSKKGHSIGLDDGTSIRIVPLTLGLKYFFPSVGCRVPVNFYAGAGMKYYFVHTHNDSDLVQKNINRNGMGGIVEAGFIAPIAHHFLLDLFVSYSMKTFGATSTSIPSVEGTGMKVGGLNVGAGIGYQF